MPGHRLPGQNRHGPGAHGPRLRHGEADNAGKAPVATPAGFPPVLCCAIAESSPLAQVVILDEVFELIRDEDVRGEQLMPFAFRR